MQGGDVPGFDKNAPEFLQSARGEAQWKEQAELDAAENEESRKKRESKWISRHSGLISGLEAAGHELSFHTSYRSGSVQSSGRWITEVRCSLCNQRYKGRLMALLLGRWFGLAENRPCPKSPPRPPELVERWRLVKWWQRLVE